MALRRDTLPYRIGVRAYIQDPDKNILIIQEHGFEEDKWSFPGGGIEENELPKDAILRELHEELGSKEFKIINTSKNMSQFEWPDEYIEKSIQKCGRAYRGQKKFQFHILYTSKEGNIKPQTSQIKRLKWVALGDLKKFMNFEGQWETTQQVLYEFGLII